MAALSVTLRRPLVVGLVLGILLLALLGPGARAQGPDDAAWQERVTKFEARWDAAKRAPKTRRIGAKVQALEELRRAEHPGAVQTLLALLGPESASVEVVAAIYGILRTLYADACVDAIAAAAKQRRRGQADALARVLGQLAMQGSERAHQTLLGFLKSGGKDLVIAACKGAAEAPYRDLVLAVAERLKATKDARVRDACIACLAKVGNMIDKLAIEALFAAFDKIKKPKPADEQRICEALRRITGYDLGNEVAAWRAWWQRARQAPDRNPAATGVQLPKPKRVPTYYGIPVTARNLVFVLDTSESMSDPVSPLLEKEFKEKDKPVITGERQPGQPAAEPPKVKKREKLPWERIKTKLDLAKAELSRTLSELEAWQRFALVTYNTEVTPIDPYVLKPVSPRNIQRAVATVKGLKPTGYTNIYGALLEAFKYSEKGGRLKGGQVFTDRALSETGAEAIYFLTDGFPTWSDDSQGFRRAAGGQKGDGEHVDPEVIVRDLMALNKARGVKIFCVGVGRHATALLGNLAGSSGGRYVSLRQ